jgi:hypothetical protein
MNVIEKLCPPALLYLIFIVVQIGLDLSLGLYLMAATKVLFGAAAVYLLDVFCEVDLGIVSWAVIATPFVMTALATSIALGLNLDHVMTTAMREHFMPDAERTKKATVAGEPPASTSAIN